MNCYHSPKRTAHTHTLSTIKEVSATCEKINESKVIVGVRIVATFLKKT